MWRLFIFTFLWTILYAWQEEIYMININTNKCVKNYWVCFQVLNFFPDKYAETAAFEKYNSNDRLVDDWLKCWTCLKPIVTFADLRGFSSAWEITFICTHW